MRWLRQLFAKPDGPRKLDCYELAGAIYIGVVVDGVKQTLVIPHPESRAPKPARLVRDEEAETDVSELRVCVS